MAEEEDWDEELGREASLVPEHEVPSVEEGCYIGPVRVNMSGLVPLSKKQKKAAAKAAVASSQVKLIEVREMTGPEERAYDEIACVEKHAEQSRQMAKHLEVKKARVQLPLHCYTKLPEIDDEMWTKISQKVKRHTPQMTDEAIDFLIKAQVMSVSDDDFGALATYTKRTSVDKRGNTMHPHEKHEQAADLCKFLDKHYADLNSTLQTSYFDSSLLESVKFMLAEMDKYNDSNEVKVQIPEYVRNWAHWTEQFGFITKQSFNQALDSLTVVVFGEQNPCDPEEEHLYRIVNYENGIANIKHGDDSDLEAVFLQMFEDSRGHWENNIGGPVAMMRRVLINADTESAQGAKCVSTKDNPNSSICKLIFGVGFVNVVVCSLPCKEYGDGPHRGQMHQINRVSPFNGMVTAFQKWCGRLAFPGYASIADDDSFIRMMDPTGSLQLKESMDFIPIEAALISEMLYFNGSLHSGMAASQLWVQDRTGIKGTMSRLRTLNTSLWPGHCDSTEGFYNLKLPIMNYTWLYILSDALFTTTHVVGLYNLRIFADLGALVTPEQGRLLGDIWLALYGKIPLCPTRISKIYATEEHKDWFKNFSSDLTQLNKMTISPACVDIADDTFIRRQHLLGSSYISFSSHDSNELLDIAEPKLYTLSERFLEVSEEAVETEELDVHNEEDLDIVAIDVDVTDYLELGGEIDASALSPRVIGAFVPPSNSREKDKQQSEASAVQTPGIAHHEAIVHACFEKGVITAAELTGLWSGQGRTEEYIPLELYYFDLDKLLEIPYFVNYATKDFCDARYRDAEEIIKICDILQRHAESFYNVAASNNNIAVCSALHPTGFVEEFNKQFGTHNRTATLVLFEWLQVVEDLNPKDRSVVLDFLLNERRILCCLTLDQEEDREFRNSLGIIHIPLFTVASYLPLTTAKVGYLDIKSYYLTGIAKRRRCSAAARANNLFRGGPHRLPFTERVLYYLNYGVEWLYNDNPVRMTLEKFREIKNDIQKLTEHCSKEKPYIRQPRILLEHWDLVSTLLKSRGWNYNGGEGDNSWPFLNMKDFEYWEKKHAQPQGRRMFVRVISWRSAAPVGAQSDQEPQPGPSCTQQQPPVHLQDDNQKKKKCRSKSSAAKKAKY